MDKFIRVLQFDLNINIYTCIFGFGIIEGKACVCKEVVEDIDKENKKVTFRVIEGDMLIHYKSLKFIMHVSPKEDGSVVHWNIEYEKREDHHPHPHSILQLVIEESRQIDVYLSKDQN